MKHLDMSLYLVTDSTYHTEESLLRTVEEACEGGVTIVQLREKHAGGREYLEKARKVRAITERYGVPLIIDDRVDVAMACGADGVHVGASDLPVAEARRILGPDKIVGATAKTVETALKAYEDGADYLGVGAIYPTTTKVVTIRTEVSTLDSGSCDRRFEPGKYGDSGRNRNCRNCGGICDHEIGEPERDGERSARGRAPDEKEF